MRIGNLPVRTARPKPDTDTFCPRAVRARAPVEPAVGARRTSTRPRASSAPPGPTRTQDAKPHVRCLFQEFASSGTSWSIARPRGRVGFRPPALEIGLAVTQRLGVTRPGPGSEPGPPPAPGARAPGFGDHPSPGSSRSMLPVPKLRMRPTAWYVMSTWLYFTEMARSESPSRPFRAKRHMSPRPGDWGMFYRLAGELSYPTSPGRGG